LAKANKKNPQKIVLTRQDGYEKGCPYSFKTNYCFELSYTNFGYGSKTGEGRNMITDKAQRLHQRQSNNNTNGERVVELDTLMFQFVVGNTHGICVERVESSLQKILWGL